MFGVLSFENISSSEKPLDVELVRLDRKIDQLSDWRGQVVILNVWATWCIPCRKEMPSLQRLSKKLNPERYTIIGVSVDDSAALVSAYLQENGIDFAQHIDKKRQVTQQILGVKSLPQTLIIGPRGVLQKRIVGFREWSLTKVESLYEFK